jgi:hypothetical protein
VLAIVDASALIAAADMSEPEHARCVEVLSRRDLYLVLPALAVAEAAYVIERRLGPLAEAAFARALAGLEIDAPLPVDWPLIADLVERYAISRSARSTHRSPSWPTGSAPTLSSRSIGGISGRSGRPAGARSASCPNLRPCTKRPRHMERRLHREE